MAVEWKKIAFADDLHAAVTIDGTSPLSLSGQAISLKNDAADAITEVDTADTPENSATKIPSSKQLYDHNAAVLSSTIHPNTTLAHLYLNVEQTDMLSSTTQRIMLDTAGVDLASGFHNEYLYGAAGVYRQSDAGSNSTTLADADANFVAAQLYRSRIAWASNAAGTLNTGIGFVNSVDSSGSCTIVKLSGANLAANYYYAIKAAHYVVPVTGYYLLFGSVYFEDTVDQKFYASIIFKNTTPISGNYVHASGTSLLIVPTFIFASLTAGDIILLAENNNSGVNTTDIMNYSAYTFLDIVFLRGA